MPTFGAWLAAAVLGIDARAAERMLEDLVGCHLVEPAGRAAGAARYRLHDLLRCFAAEKAEEEPEAERRQTITRALGGWLSLSEQAAARLPRSVLTALPGDATRWPADSEPITDATEWFEAAAARAARGHQDRRGRGDDRPQLGTGHHVPAVLRPQRPQRGVVPGSPPKRSPGCPADRGRAALLLGLGQLHIYWDRFPEAFAALRESLAISEEIGDVPGIARALGSLAAHLPRHPAQPTRRWSQRARDRAGGRDRRPPPRDPAPRGRGGAAPGRGQARRAWTSCWKKRWNEP